MTIPSRTGPTSQTQRGASSLGPEPLVLEALSQARNEGELARLLTGATAHVDGLDADSAHVLWWNGVAGVFEAAAQSERAPGGTDLSTWLEKARVSMPAALSARARSFEPDALDQVSLAAWREGAMRCGRPGGGLAAWREAARVAVMPLRWGGADRGLLVADVREGGSSGRLERFAALVRLALELRERSAECARRAAHAAALAELTQAMVAPRNVVEILHSVARLTAAALEADGATLWTLVPDGKLMMRVTHGPAGVRERLGRALEPAAAAASETGRARLASPATDDALLPEGAAAEAAAFVMWPISAYGRSVGALGVWTVHGGCGALALERAEREFLATVAQGTGLALEHARRLEELRAAERKERDATRWARQREALAALGERVAGSCQESLKPVASIRAFSSRLLRSLGEDDPSRQYVEVIVREADRLDRMLAEQRAEAEVGPPALEMVGLNDVADRVLQRSGEALVRRRARVLKKLAPDLPRLLLDPRGMDHVVSVLVTYALDSIALGGRIRVETRRLPQHALLELAHDGGRIEALEQLFAPFDGARPSPAAPGMHVAQRVIQEHGGELRVRADGEWSTVVTVTLPISGNGDRRRAGRDRRVAGNRRRPAAKGAAGGEARG